MTSPIKPQDDDWWNVDVSRRETIWIGLTVGWAFTIFAWMNLWTRIGEQNQVGETYRVTSDSFQSKVS
ncbi:MAG: cytochrome C oxidase subunit II, partial [Halobacteria archaeon]|nr:cytochrome C oxidase subunit II [Halobacteria archaeon]